MMSKAFLSMHSGSRWTMQNLILGIHQFQKDVANLSAGYTPSKHARMAEQVLRVTEKAS
jgi:hypothetical protein